MTTIIIASTRKSAGKTALALGLAKALARKSGYIKPLGDRLLYRKKRLWDYDASVMISALGTGASAEEITIGFERSKLRYMYDEPQVAARLLELARLNAEGREVLFVEAGSDLAHGTSVHLDAFSMARTLKGKLLIVAGGPGDAIVDDLAYLKRRVDLSGLDIGGVVANKVADPADFAATQGEEIRALGFPLLGVLPYRQELTSVSVRFLSDCLFARVVAGEAGLDRRIEHVMVAAMSADSLLRDPLFGKEGKLVITSGDRSDIVLAALDSGTAAIVLANNILPPPNIVSRAGERGIPLLLVPAHTFQVAKQVDDLEPLITKDDHGKQELLEQLVKAHVDVARVAGW
jgi:BioD-like phosphotransacetylase family protein